MLQDNYQPSMSSASQGRDGSSHDHDSKNCGHNQGGYHQSRGHAQRGGSKQLGHYSCQISWCARFARSQSTRQWTASIGLRRTISQAVRREATLWQPMALTQISTPTEEPQSHHSHRRWWFTGTRDKIISTMLVGMVWQLVMLIIQLYIPQIARCVYVFFPRTHSAEGKEYNPHDERHLSFDRRNLISYILITNLFA